MATTGMAGFDGRPYEMAGFARIAELVEWPEGHSNIALGKTVAAAGAA